MIGRFFRVSAILIAAIGFAILSNSSVFAQTGGGGGTGGGAGGANNNNQNNVGGIEIDANGLLTMRALVDNAGILNQQRALAAQAALNRDLQQPSKLRKVSITRLEREVAKLVEAGQPVPADMLYLAGLTRITHVFFYPETNDIVVAGPAEGYFLTADNRVVGMHTGQATLQLQDLIVALRAFAPNDNSARLITCSIDPTQEGIVRMNEAVKQVSSRFRPGDEAAVVDIFCRALGLQVITINGVSTNTHFARVLVEADYHMKLIGIGLERPPVKMTTFIEKSKPSSAKGLVRWFFQPNYDCVHMTEDGTAMEMVGSGVKLVGEDESVTAKGERKTKGGVNPASQAYCNSFTRMYDKAAAVSPLWGELRNLIDMSIVAAFIQKQDLYGKANWTMPVFSDESKFAVENLEAPKFVQPVANAVWKGNYFMTPIAGGVSIQPRVALNTDRAQIDSDGKIQQVKDQNDLSKLQNDQWWWD